MDDNYAVWMILVAELLFSGWNGTASVVSPFYFGVVLIPKYGRYIILYKANINVMQRSEIGICSCCCHS